tara:strand:+ start:20144 stop:20317 length:174 start_codon:yes stop_codon:yes gene_type:complete
MKIDKHYDPYEDLEKEIIADIKYASDRIGGIMHTSTRVNSKGESCKVITIEYDFSVQ